MWSGDIFGRPPPTSSPFNTSRRRLFLFFAFLVILFVMFLSQESMFIDIGSLWSVDYSSSEVEYNAEQELNQPPQEEKSSVTDQEASKELNDAVNKAIDETQESMTNSPTPTRTITRTTSSPTITTKSPATMATTTSSPTVKIRRNEQLNKWIEENRGKKILIIQADNRELQPNQPISHSYIHSSIISLDYFAKKHGYAYVWVTGLSPGPNDQPIAGYWNKVPASMIGLRLARMANIPNVIYVDSDSTATEFFDPSSIEKCQLESMLERHQANFIVSNEVEHWSRLVKGIHVYHSQPLNSGVYMFDTSNKSEQLLQYWWLISTNQTTPYEFQKSKLFVKTVFDVLGRANSKVIQLPTANVTSKLYEKFNRHYMVHTNDYQLKQKSLEWNLRIEIHYRTDFGKSSAFQETLDSCCGENQTICSNILLEANVDNILKINSIECSYQPFSTMKTWPGDQDRLNWIVTEVFNSTSKVVDDLGICDGSKFRHRKVCFQHLCNAKSTYVGQAFHAYLDQMHDPLVVNKTQEEWDFKIGPELLSQVWKIKTTPLAMKVGSEFDESWVEFES